MSSRRPGYRTTIGWSLLTSGMMALLLQILPFPSVYWGLLLIATGIAVMWYR